MAKRKFKFDIQYFKVSGKYYGSEEDFEYELDCCGTEDPSAYMSEMCDLLRQWNKEGKLPGLRSGTWNGPILVDCEQGYPCLILSKDKF